MRPDFLCIGAQKAGTTWLYQALRRHPQVQMPPVKEIHYFDRRKKPYALDMFSRNAPTRRRFRRWLWDGLQAGRTSWHAAAWCLRFFCLPRGDTWYTGLFLRPAGSVTGDITPGYARLERERVAHVRRLLPDARIIYILRDPIDRAWSQAAMYFRQYHGNTNIAAVAPAVVRRFVLDPYNLSNGAYAKVLALWREFYPAEQMLIVHYDEIEEDAVGVLTGIAAFLGIVSDRAIFPADVRERVYTQPYPAIPTTLASELAHYFYPSLQQLHTQIGTPYVQSWLRHAETLLESRLPEERLCATSR